MAVKLNELVLPQLKSTLVAERLTKLERLYFGNGIL